MGHVEQPKLTSGRTGIMAANRTAIMRQPALQFESPWEATADNGATPRWLVLHRNLCRPTLSALLLLLLLFIALPQAQAQEPSQALSRCFADNTSGKERKDLARWSFFAMAAHAEIKQFASPDIATASEETDKAMAMAFTRLVTDVCRTQVQSAFKQGRTKSIEDSLQVLMSLAMQELMSDQNVITSMGKYTRFLDQTKWLKAISGG